MLPWLDEREAAAARRAILSGWVTQGPEVAAFEREFCEYVGAKHACAVSSCTTALHLALVAVGVQPGDEVITVSHSFIATANAIRYCGAMPVFVDIEPATFNMDPALVETAISPRTKAILVVHQIGMPCDLAALLPIARRRKLPLIEDAACAIGSEIRWDGRWERIGRPHADIACFSFHPRKLVTTGDGGMITTATMPGTRLRLCGSTARAYPTRCGMARSRLSLEGYPDGLQLPPDGYQAAVERSSLRSCRGHRAAAGGWRRVRLAAADVRDDAAASAGVGGAIIRVAGAWSGIDQRIMMQERSDGNFHAARIMRASRGAYPRGTWSCGPAHPACDCPAGSCRLLRESESAQDTTILLPLFHQLTDDDQRRVTASLRTVVDAMRR